MANMSPKINDLWVLLWGPYKSGVNYHIEHVTTSVAHSARALKFNADSPSLKQLIWIPLAYCDSFEECAEMLQFLIDEGYLEKKGLPQNA